MNEQRNDVEDASLRMALRGLRRDVEPSHDLWPGIADRLQSMAQQPQRAARTRRAGWLWPLAMAASLVLAVGVAWQFKAVNPAQAVAPRIAQASPGNRGETLFQREADSMTVHYQAALREMAPGSLPAGWQPGAQALDRSAIEIRTAMQHDPNSRLLLECLRATYTRRLALARRALYA